MFRVLIPEHNETDIYLMENYFMTELEQITGIYRGSLTKRNTDLSVHKNSSRNDIRNIIS